MNIGSYWIYHKGSLEDDEEEMESNPESKLWHVVRHCKFNDNGKEGQQSITGYKLMPKDIIKLGRVRFKVREIISPAYKKKQALA